MKSSLKKYRPYFTHAELSHLRDALQVYVPQAPILLRYLEKYISDIEDGYRKENISLAPSLEQKLGLGSEVVSHEISIADLLESYQSAGFAGMKSKDIQRLQEHRYTSDLMAPQEMYDHESSQGVPEEYRTRVASDPAPVRTPEQIRFYIAHSRWPLEGEMK